MKTSCRTDLTPTKLFLFLTLKTTLKGHRFQDIEEVKENATRNSKKNSKSGRNIASGLDCFEGTVCKNDVSYLIKLFYSQFGLFSNTPRMCIWYMHLACKRITVYLAEINQTNKNKGFIYIFVWNTIKFSKIINYFFVGENCDIPLYSKNVQEKEAQNYGSMAAGVVVALILVAIIVALLFYYRRRVANLKTEIAHVQYIADPQMAPGE